ncbi:MAG: winged helix-turn-helix transcriptional regulator [Oscillospiraceae bacterium]|nr:winged helix-turn-helix transcriptional regulator [Oscillospiraceae bacterium]
MDKNIPIGALIKMAANGIERNMNCTVTSLGLTASQSHILHFICCNSGKIHQKEVEKKFDLSHATVSGIIDRLVSKGFIERLRDKNDGRYYALYATKKALEYEDKIHGFIEESERKMLVGISEEQEKALRAALTKIIINSGGLQPERLCYEEENK